MNYSFSSSLLYTLTQGKEIQKAKKEDKKDRHQRELWCVLSKCIADIPEKFLLLASLGWQCSRK